MQFADALGWIKSPEFSSSGRTTPYRDSNSDLHLYFAPSADYFRIGHYPFGTKKADRKLARFVRLPLISSESPAQKYGWMPADLPTFNLPQGPSHERDREVSSILATIRRLDFEARLTDRV